MKYKMIVSDCDDTLLSDDMTVSDYVKGSIRRYIDKGGKFVIATGRMYYSVLPYCMELDLHGEVICYQGAVIADIDSGEILDEMAMDLSVAAELCEYLESKNAYFHIYDDSYYYVKEDCDWAREYSEFCKAKYKVVGENLSEFIRNNNFAPKKIMLLDDEKNIVPLMALLKEKFASEFLINTSKKWMIEFVPVGISKGLAVKRLAEKYNIKREEIVCVGDSLNDVTMLEYAGVGVCVQNGSLDAMKSADAVCPSNNDDGVAYVVNKYGSM